MGGRNEPDAAEWTQALPGAPAMAKRVEQGKKQVVEQEIKGKTFGAISLSATASRLGN